MSASAVGLLSALIAAGLALAGSIYSTVKQSRAKNREIEEVTGVQVAHAALVGTVTTLRAEYGAVSSQLTIQRQEHAEQLRSMAEDLAAMRAHHADCEYERELLADRVAALEAVRDNQT